MALDELLGCKHKGVAESHHVDRSGGRLSHPGHLLHQGDLFGQRQLNLTLNNCKTFSQASIRPSNFPPGPPCLGWIGSLPYLDVRNLSRSFINLSQKYGDIFSIFVGTKPVVVLNSWTLISEGSHLTLYYLHIKQGGF